MTTLKCFVIMPFGDEFSGTLAVVLDAVANAVPGQVIACRSLKEVQAAGRITDDIVDALQGAALCVADVSGSNPNVMWETGYAMALAKPTILIGRKPVDNLPFDLRVHRVIPYSPEDLQDLRQILAEGVRQTLARYEVQPKDRPECLARAASQSIVVTGTMRADFARVTHRIRTVIEPYLGLDAQWYCGSVGTVDESALEFLVARRERAAAVGYHRYDLSEGVRKLVEEDRVSFVDASVQSLPKGLTGPSERDIFFCAKADLVILFWDGQSSGTRDLIQYFSQNGRNLLTAFV